ncbi:MAG: YHYH protein [Ignavibacteriota bacterium]
MKYISFLLSVLCFAATSAAQLSPDVTSWIINSTGKTGYGGSVTNIQQVQYSDDYVYISASCIPGYDIGPWPGNPNIPKNQNFVYKITRHPQPNSGTAQATQLGHIGVWTNGVSIFNAKDAMSYQNKGKWNQNAILVEGASFDNCLGHPAPNGEYHHHLNPRCLYDDKDSLHHSPIIGFAFDGFPVYGAFGFPNLDGTGSPRRILSSYRKRSITDRSALPDGTVLVATEYGPAISTQYPLGYYIEDFEFIKSSGDLDEHNGRFCVTPEYPSGIYAYFVTLDEMGNAAYPYTLGLTYYGNVTLGNIGPGGGHNIISEPVKTYTSSGVSSDESQVEYSLFPNPATNFVTIYIAPSSHNNLTMKLCDALGNELKRMKNVQPGVPYDLDLNFIPNGSYYLSLTDEQGSSVRKLIITK